MAPKLRSLENTSSSEESVTADQNWLACSKMVCLLLSVLFPVILWAALNISFSTASISQWLPSSGQEQETYAEFLEWFRDDLFLIVSWSDCRLDDPRLQKIAEELRSRSASEISGAVQRVVTTRDLFVSLTASPTNLPTAAVAQRLHGWMIGADRTCAILIELTQESQDQHKLVLEMLLDIAQETAGLAREDLKLGGSAYEAVFVDETSSRSLKLFLIPSFLAALFVAWLCIRDLKLTLVVLAIGGYGQVLGIALVFASGGQLNAVLIVLPSLLFMLTVSATVHLVHYFRDAMSSGCAVPSVQALKAGWLPCTLATLTTVIGLMSLSISVLQPVREFGIYASIGLLGATVIALATFPFLASLTLPRQFTSDEQSNGSLKASFTKRRTTAFIDRMLSLSFVNVVVLLAAMFVAAAGLQRLSSTVRIENMFAANSEILQNYEWLEEHIGPLVAVEVLCSFPDDSSALKLEDLQIVQRLHQSVLELSDIQAAYSALTLVPSVPAGSGIRTTARRAVYRKLLEQRQPFLIEQKVLAIQGGERHWRISAKVPAIHSFGYGEQRERVAMACQKALDQLDKPTEVRLSFTGLSPVFHDAQHQILSDLGRSFVAAFVLILPIMILVLRSLTYGLIAMIPNVAPAVLCCGAMGWLNIPLDIASILTISVALGIAVDDTLHFVTWFSRARRSGANHREAAKLATQKCSRAILQTTLICCCTMLVFLPTEFLPTRKFAILLSLMLSTAVVGDLVLLPSLLSLSRKQLDSPNANNS